MARKHLDAVRRAAAQVDAARRALADRMLEAHEKEETVADIGQAAGLQRSRVYDLLREARERRPEQ